MRACTFGAQDFCGHRLSMGWNGVAAGPGRDSGRYGGWGKVMEHKQPRKGEACGMINGFLRHGSRWC